MRLRAVCLITATSVALAATMLVGAVANAQTLATNASKSTTIARGLVDPGAWLVSSGLYLSSASSSPQGSTEVTLTHVNSSTGKIEARAHLDAQPVSVTETGGKLWFATDTVTKGGLTTATSVTALNPSTLRTEVKLKLPAVAAVPSLAAAGGYLWAADGSALVRISPSNGTVTKTISAASSDGPHAILTGIGTDSRGRSLVTSVLNRAAAPRVQRRNSRSGSVERQSATLGAVSAGHLSVYIDHHWYRGLRPAAIANHPAPHGQADREAILERDNRPGLRGRPVRHGPKRIRVHQLLWERSNRNFTLLSSARDQRCLADRRRRGLLLRPVRARYVSPSQGDGRSDGVPLICDPKVVGS
jgi:hypothetical protein